MPRYTIKEKRFLDELPHDWNQTQAAIRAGYSPKTARQIGAELMTKPKIKDAVEKIKAEQSRRTGMNVDVALLEMARLARFNPKRLFNADGRPKSITELDDDTAAAIIGLEVMEIYEGRGDDRRFVGHLKKYKLADKKGALESFFRHYGMFVERHEHTGKDGGPIEHVHKPDLSKLTEEELDVLESIVSKASETTDS